MPTSVEAAKLVEGLSIVLTRATALAETYANANAKAVMGEVKAIGAGQTFNLVRESLHREICLILVGIFDDDKRSLTFETAGRQLSKDNVDHLEHLAAALELFEKTKKEGFYGELVKLRNKVIAHTDTDAEHGARFGDERNLLVLAEEIMRRLHQAISRPYDPSTIRKVFEVDSQRFWGSLRSK